MARWHPLLNAASVDPPLRLERAHARRHCIINIKHQHHANCVIIMWICKHPQLRQCSKQAGYSAMEALWHTTGLHLAITGFPHTSWQLSRAIHNFYALSCSPEKAQRWWEQKFASSATESHVDKEYSLILKTLTAASRVLTCTVGYILFDIHYVFVMKTSANQDCNDHLCCITGNDSQV